ncbi:MAG TPA: amidohydrolase family protein [Candidatus Limnocylindria bacterium]|nr:amidohydrolase family protein [Candidatus Limnocylindria bacterium]
MSAQGAEVDMTVVDVHTHILSEEYIRLLAEHGGPTYEVKVDRSGGPTIHRNGAPFHTLQPAMFDVDMRLQAMDRGGVDIGVLSLAAPSVYWGSDADSLQAARQMNDYIAGNSREHPDRFAGIATLPWRSAADSLPELDRAIDELGLKGVMVLANIEGRPLTDPAYAPIWEAIDRRGLAVFVHPITPPGADQMDMLDYNLVAAVGFMIDTTLAFARMIYDGFFDRYPNISMIAPHAGATLPYLAGRLDQCWDKMPACRVNISQPPSSYLRRIYYDTVCYRQDALDLCLKVGGPSQLLYGSDYPHNISDMTGCLARAEALPGEVVEDVKSRNAMRIFGL